MSTAQPLINPGSVLAGRWQVQDFIGNGETGEVYGVRDMHSTGTFALKLFWPNALGQPEIWSAVQQTARTASGLGVEGVARAHDFGIDANSARPFVVCERVSWSSLADRLRLRGPLTPAEVTTALGVLARALDAAHAVGVVHRDLKPENIFISPENPSWVRVSDFGVALLRSASPPPPGWGGTVGWVSPDAADPNARSAPAMDIFALGLVTFFALSGGALHRAARTSPIDPGALWNELTAPLDSASVRARELGASLDPAFDAWFQRAVAPLPQARFGSISEMASAFEAIARTLVAPQSQNAVALPGVAAAIAQPLIFQPESLPPPPVVSAAAALAAAAVPAMDAALSGGPAYGDSAPKKQRGAAPLLIGGAVLIFAITGLGAYGLYHHRRAAAEQAAAAALASASAAAASALANVPAAPTAPVVPEPAAVAPAATPEPVAAAAAPEPVTPASEPVAAAPKPTAAKAVAPAAKPAALPTTKPAVAAAAAAPTKPATPLASAKPAAIAKPAVSAKTALKVGAPIARPKCGSTFLPCGK